MDIKELKKMTVPKLRDLAKQATDLQGVIGMKKEELIEAIAKAQGIASEALAKDVTTISSVKQEIRALQKHRDELLASSKERVKIARMRGKIKKLKRLTRHLGREAKVAKAAQAAQPAAPAPAAAPSETAPAAG